MASAARLRVGVLDVMPPRSREVISARFRDRFEVVFADQGSSAERHRLAADCDVLLVMWGAIDADLIGAMGRCRVVQKLGVGIDKVDVEAAHRHRLPILKAAGINADAVAELAVLLTLAVTRCFPRAVAECRAGHFGKEALRAESVQLLGRTVGLVGFGHIGQAAARRFRGFGMEIVYHDPRRAEPEVERDLAARFLPLAELLAVSDVVSLHLPAGPQTRGLINAARLAAMKRGSILINTARGALVDEPALVDAITRGHLLGAGLDVAAVEPLPTTSPLLALDRVVVTPHIGGAVADNFPRVIAHAYRNVTAVVNGAPVPPDDVVVWPEEAA